MKIITPLILAFSFLLAQAEEVDVTPTKTPKFPNSEVLNQESKSLKFYDDLIKNKVVAINFVFSSCPTICTAMEVNFSQLQTSLKESGLKDVHLISVTVDPKTDIPARLKEWSKKFEAKEGWSFITGKPKTIDHLLKELEVFTADVNDHPSFILVGNDTTGTWKRINSLASPKLLSQELSKLAAEKK